MPRRRTLLRSTLLLLAAKAIVLGVRALERARQWRRRRTLRRRGELELEPIEHLWDELDRLQNPRALVPCVRCFTIRSSRNVHEHCPGAPNPFTSRPMIYDQY